MAIGDIYQIVDTQEEAGQKALNVYFYKVQSASVTDNDAGSVVAAYIATILPGIAAFQNNDVVHVSVKAQNLFDEADAHEELISVAGDRGEGEILGTFEAVGFRLVGDNASVRSGAKRFAGIDETAVTDGVIDSEVIIGLLDAAAGLLFADLPWGLLAAETLIPVIVKRILTGDEYRLPTNSGEAVVSRITDALWSPIVTSQVSRKIGRGE